MGRILDRILFRCLCRLDFFQSWIGDKMKNIELSADERIIMKSKFQKVLSEYKDLLKIEKVTTKDIKHLYHFFYEGYIFKLNQGDKKDGR